MVCGGKGCHDPVMAWCCARQVQNGQQPDGSSQRILERWQSLELRNGVLVLCLHGQLVPGGVSALSGGGWESSK